MNEDYEKINEVLKNFEKSQIDYDKKLKESYRELNNILGNLPDSNIIKEDLGKYIISLQNLFVNSGSERILEEFRKSNLINKLENKNE